MINSARALERRKRLEKKSSCQTVIDLIIREESRLDHLRHERDVIKALLDKTDSDAQMALMGINNDEEFFRIKDLHRRLLHINLKIDETHRILGSLKNQ